MIQTIMAIFSVSMFPIFRFDRDVIGRDSGAFAGIGLGKDLKSLYNECSLHSLRSLFCDL